MRDYGQIQSSFWQSSDARKLSDQGKLLVAYLLTGPHTSSIGCFRLPNGYVSADLDWPFERVSETLSELSSIGFCDRCGTTDFVLIYQFIRWNPVQNGNVAKNVRKQFEAVPKDFRYISELAASMERFGNHWAKGFETVLKGYSKSKPNLTEPNPTNRIACEGARTGFDEAGFKAFIELYPKKTGLTTARQWWTAVQERRDEIMADVQARIDHPDEWTIPKFIPAPGKYLGEVRWEDDWRANHDHGEAKPRTEKRSTAAADNDRVADEWARQRVDEARERDRARSSSGPAPGSAN